MKLDMNTLVEQAQEMQEQMVRAQEEPKDGRRGLGRGGMVSVKANSAVRRGDGDSTTHDDPDDLELAPPTSC